MTGDWATWALQFLIVLGVGRVWLAIDANTKALADLREDIPKRYATKEETNRHHDEDSARFKEVDGAINSVRERVHGVDLRVTAIDGSVKDAQAGLRG